MKKALRKRIGARGRLRHAPTTPMVRRRQPRRRCPQRGAGCAGTPARTPLDAGSGLRRARSESSARAPARPSASAGSCLLPAGSQASRKASADCARTTRLCAGLFAISGRPLRPAATAGGQLRRAGSIPASVDASGARFSSCAHALAGSPRDILIPQAKSARSQRITPPPQGRLPPPSAPPPAPVSRSERVLWYAWAKCCYANWPIRARS